MMRPLRTLEARSIALVSEGLGVDRQQGLGTKLAAYVVLFFAACGVPRAVDDANIALAAICVLGLLVALALFVTSRATRRNVSTQQQRAIDVECEWARNQPLQIEGYRAYIASLRPVFDIVLAEACDEETIIEAIRRHDARILTSAEPGRVRVELPPVKVDLHVEDAPPMEFPDLARTKIVIERVQALGIPMRIEMGTHPAL